MNTNTIIPILGCYNIYLWVARNVKLIAGDLYTQWQCMDHVVLFVLQSGTTLLGNFP